MSWDILYEKIEKYVFRIDTQQGYGTGFLFAYNHDKSVAAIATAAHVVQEAHDWKQPLRVTHHASKQSVFLDNSLRAIILDAERDSATIVIRTDLFALPPTTFPLMDSNKIKKRGAELAWVGFPAVASSQLCLFTGRVSAFLLTEDCYLIDGVAINGVSGGPVFYELSSGTPQIVGTVSAYVANRVGGAALPGLLRAQDITSFQQMVQAFKNVEEAKKKENKSADTLSASTPPVAPSPPPVAAQPAPVSPKPSTQSPGATERPAKKKRAKG